MGLAEWVGLQPSSPSPPTAPWYNFLPLQGKGRLEPPSPVLGPRSSAFFFGSMLCHPLPQVVHVPPKGTVHTLDLGGWAGLGGNMMHLPQGRTEHGIGQVEGYYVPPSEK